MSFFGPPRCRGLGVLALAFLLLSAAGPAAAQSPADGGGRQKPNIVFIFVDDLGYADLGCFGQKTIKTPNIDALAAGGTRFTQCYAGSTVCAPSRSVLMTGQHTGHTRVRGNTGKSGRVPLQPQDLTVAEVLKGAGYATGITGKWGLGEPGTDGVPNRQGFDEWFGYLNQKHAHEYYPEYLWKDEQKVTLEGNAGGGQKQYSHDLFTEFALDFVRRRKDEPFFLYLAYTIPHDKYQVPELGEYADAPWPANARTYAAMVARMDRDVGRLTGLLKELKLEEDTIVFFCSDNGAAQRWEGIFDSSGPLRGRKRDLHEGGIRTPMIVRWPGRVPAGQTSDAIWWLADVLPTLAEVGGAAVPEGARIDGVSVLPSLLGKEQPALRDRPLYWEFHEGGFGQAARQANWKAVRQKHGAALELYDLSKDPGEKNDVSADHPEVAARMAEYLKSARTESPEWPVPSGQGKKPAAKKAGAKGPANQKPAAGK